MIIPTILIIPPAILALLLFMLVYYQRDPPNRITDRRFLLALACFAVIAGQMVVIVQHYDGTIPSVVLFVAAMGLLIVALWHAWDGPIKALRSLR
jgi:hypothetical protein